MSKIDYKWESRAISYYYYDSDTGKVVGTIHKTTFSDDIWSARVNGDYLGDYISQVKAMKAVEKKVMEVDSYTTEGISPDVNTIWNNWNESQLGENH